MDDPTPVENQILNCLPLVIVVVFLAWFAMRGSLAASRSRRLIDNLPTSKTQGVFVGLVELKGAVRCAEPLISHLAEVPCVYYAFEIEESWSRMVTRTESDGKGGRRTVTETESGWTTVSSNEELIPFYLEDDTGILLIRPGGSSVGNQRVFEYECSSEDPLYHGKGPVHRVRDSDGVRRFTERALPVGTTVYIVGQARERQDIVAAEIAADANAPEFFISLQSEDEMSGTLGRRAVVLFLVGLATVLFGQWLYYVFSQQEVDSTAIDLFFGEAVLFTLIWLLGWTLTIYNSLVELRQRVEQGWGQVDIQLKRRHDLIPNLVDCVKGFRDYEASTQATLAEMRSQLDVTAPGQPGTDPHALSGQVAMLREAYPELQANENFLALQTSLIDTEQRIALARAYFNEIAMFWNTRLEVFPDRFIASFANMKPRALMEADDFERAPVQVSFSG